MATRWRAIWFEPGEAADLAICRILVCGFMLMINLDRGGEGVESLFAYEMWRPVSFFVFLSSHIPTSDQLATLFLAFKLGLLLGMLGVFTRASLGVACVFGILAVGWGMNFGKVNHLQHVALVSIGILALGRSGDVLSVDAWLRVRRGKQNSFFRAAPSPDYTWPARCAGLVMTLMFFGAGVSKVRHGGLEWIFSDNFSNILIIRQYVKTRVIADWGLYIASVPWLAQLMALGTVFGEFLAPLAVVSRAARFVIVPTLFMMQLGIAVLMHTHALSPNFACYAFWVPWTRLGRRLGIGNQS